MYIEEITIDGFKSYAQRVVVPNFDPQFNAITGLNGSGKSNILDSICFVLGISNLQRVRASSLQELIYKQGQAGVTKASVSIKFNNADKNKSPAGYEQYSEITVTRQLAIGGRDKFLINGKLAQRQRVVDLFHSVSLNVNNPHFLIMQGMITKVLNMRPAEILGMLEEAAGTKMYETKRQGALKTLEKKQSKVDEINQMLAQEIGPALEKLKKEKVEYEKWSRAADDLERLKRYVIAYQYTIEQRNANGDSEELQAQRQAALAARQALEGLEVAITEAEDAVEGLKKEKELQAGGEVKELNDKVDDLNRRLVKETSQYKIKAKNLEKEQKALDSLNSQLAEVEVAALEARLQGATTARDEAAAALAAAQRGVEAAECELAGAKAGDGRDESNRSLQERLQDAVLAQTTAEGELKQADVKAKHIHKQLGEARKLLGSKQSEAQRLHRDLQAAQADIDKCNRAMGQLKFDPSVASSLEHRVEEEQRQVAALKDKVAELTGQLAALNFTYRDPEAGFDRTRVKGALARLVRVQEPSTATALEVVAAGKLYQVVVDTEQTAKALLSNGQLKQRVTIIPLNKVSCHVASPAVQQAAASLSNGKATLALELVGYNQELRAAMKYAFGNAFVCKDASTAKKLAYNRSVATRCITLEGDDFNPSGLLTGGSRNRGQPLLARVAELQAAEAELSQHSQSLQEAKAQLASMQSETRQYQRLAKELELKQHALELVQQRVAASESAQLQDNVSSLEQELAAAQEAAEQAEQKKQDMAASAKRLEAEMRDYAKDKQKHVKAAQAKLTEATKALEAAKKAAKAAEAVVTTLLAERESNASEREALQQQIAAQQQVITELEADVQSLGQAVASMKRAHDECAAKLQDRTTRLQECDSEIKALVKEKAGLLKHKDDAEADCRKQENRLKSFERGMQEARENAAKLEQEFPWIHTEKRSFGKAGSDYDWETQDPEAVRQACSAAQQTVQELNNRVNKRVMQMYEKAEQEYSELSRKKQTVENDKIKIEKVIGELDEKKKEAVRLTWESVNSKFGSIFSTLLPGTNAKLEPVEGSSFLEGLEVKVAFGGVWKQSLTELSGGQRSLLALSLVLAMLLYKPAPLYILDEVDAALDLSHTQNIGRMIDKHFPQSQFIVVSLKEGMFNNANVIFRTKFVDGVSTVTRTVSDKRARAAGKGSGVAGYRQPLRENAAA